MLFSNAIKKLQRFITARKQKGKPEDRSDKNNKASSDTNIQINNDITSCKGKNLDESINVDNDLNKLGEVSIHEPFASIVNEINEGIVMVQKECENHNATQSMSIIEDNKMASSEHDECTTSCQNLNEDNKILEHETNEEIDTHFLEDEYNNELQEIDYDTENDAQVIASDNDEKLLKSDCK